MQRRQKVFCALLALLPVVGVLSVYAARRRAAADIFAPVDAYIFRERTAYDNVPGFGLTAYRLIHLKNITVPRANELLMPRLVKRGFTIRRGAPTDGACYDHRLGPNSAEEVIMLNSNVEGLHEGVLIFYAAPPQGVQFMYARILTMGKRKPWLVNGDMRAFLDE